MNFDISIFPEFGANKTYLFRCVFLMWHFIGKSNKSINDIVEKRAKNKREKKNIWLIIK